MKLLCDNCKREYEGEYEEKSEWGEERVKDLREKLCPECLVDNVEI